MSGYVGLFQSKNQKQERNMFNEQANNSPLANAAHVVGQDAYIDELRFTYSNTYWQHLMQMKAG